MSATPASRKRRGRDTELLAARYLAEKGWPYAMPTGAGASGIDITGTPGLGWEVKARAGFEPMANLRQAVRNAGDNLPLVLLRPNGVGPAQIGLWPVFTTLDHMVWLLRSAGYGDPLPGKDDLLSTIVENRGPSYPGPPPSELLRASYENYGK